MTTQKSGAPHYSPYTVGGGLIFVSGQLPLRPAETPRWRLAADHAVRCRIGQH